MEIPGLLGLVLGWLVGLLSNIIIEWNRNLRRAKELKRSILIEIDELRIRLAIGVFQISSHLGTVDHSLIEWMKKIHSSYHGIYENPEWAEKMGRFANLNETDLKNVMAQLAHPERGLTLKQFQLPLLSSSISDLRLFTPEFQRLSLDVLRQLGTINEEVAISNSNFYRTFDTSIKDENRTILENNIKYGYQNIARMSKAIVQTMYLLCDTRT